jgi:hypothetical protein
MNAENQTLQLVTAAICRASDAKAVIVLIMHNNDRAEILMAHAGDEAPDLAATILKVANSIADGGGMSLPVIRV